MNTLAFISSGSALYTLLFIGMICGVYGGFVMQRFVHKAGIDPIKFKQASLFMLAQDVFVAAFFMASWSEAVIFIVIIFLMPAIGYKFSENKIKLT